MLEFTFLENEDILFIDTSVYLNFYSFSDDELESLKKLVFFIKERKIKLIITQQVLDEFKRRREGVIKIALKCLQEEKLENGLPGICNGYEEFEEMVKLKKAFVEKRNLIMKKIGEDAGNKELKADKILEELFQAAEVLKVNKEDIEEANFRMKIGNPPGKKGSLGDAINWNILLKEIPQDKDICIIARDNDYSSDLNDKKLSQFLKEEWEDDKKSKIHFYKSLTDFFSESFPEANIKVISELKKDFNINRLISSGCFQTTHLAILNLNKFSEFTDDEIKSIVEAGVANSQISWISSDEDVRDFFRKLIKDKEDILDSDIFKKFKEIYLDDDNREK